MVKDLKVRIFLLLRAIVSFGLLGLLAWMMWDDIGKIWDILKTSHKLFFSIALLLCIPSILMLSYRLGLLMEGQKIALPMKDYIYLTFVGYFFNNFLPTAIGGDIVKAYYASKKTNNKIASYAAVFSDRFFGLMAIIVIAVIGVIFIGKSLNNVKVSYTVFVISLIFIILTFLLFRKKIDMIPGLRRSANYIHILKEKLFQLFSAINLYRNNPSLIAKIIILSMVMQILTIASIYFFILSLGGEMHFLKLFLIIPLVWAISMIPSLNGLGVREGAFVYFLKSDIGVERAFAISLLWLGMTIIYSMIGGILHLMHPVKPRLDIKGVGR